MGTTIKVVMGRTHTLEETVYQTYYYGTLEETVCLNLLHTNSLRDCLFKPTTHKLLKRLFIKAATTVLFNRLNYQT